MPDEKKGLSSNDRWKAEHTAVYRIRVAESSGIIAAMGKMTEATGIKETEYLRASLVNQLRKDGYLPESPKTK